MPIGQRQDVMVITGWYKVESSSRLHFLIEAVDIHFANGVPRQIDFPQNSSEDGPLGDTEDQVAIGQLLECGWEITLFYAGIVVPDWVAVPVCK